MLILQQCIDTEIKLQNGGSFQHENDRCAVIRVSLKETTSTRKIFGNEKCTS